MAIDPVTYTRPAAPPPFVPGKVPLTPFNTHFGAIHDALEEMAPAINLMRVVYNEWIVADTGWGALLARLFTDNEIKLGTSTLELFNSTEALSLRITLAGDGTYFRSDSPACFFHVEGGSDVFEIAQRWIIPDPVTDGEAISIGVRASGGSALNMDFAGTDVYIGNKNVTGKVIIEGVEMLNGTILTGMSMRFRYRTATAPTGDFTTMNEDFDVVTVNPTGSARKCVLPTSVEGVCYWVVNANTTHNCAVRQPADDATVATLTPGQRCLVCSVGSTYITLFAG